MRNNIKHPVSILQDKMAMTKKPLPVYEMEYNASYGFRCIVTVDRITAEGCGVSKQNAKYVAARLALIRLGFIKDTELSSLPEAEPSSTNHVITVIGGNYIGALNELVDKKKLLHPKYLDLGLQDKQWVIKCTLTGYVAKGYGTQKKEAKQQAARRMLKKFAHVAPKTSKFNMKDQLVLPDNQTAGPFISSKYQRDISVSPEYEGVDEFETDDEEQVSETASSINFKNCDERWNFEIVKNHFPMKPAIRRNPSDKTNDEYVESVTKKLCRMGLVQKELAQKLINEVLQHGLANKLNSNSIITLDKNKLENYKNVKCYHTAEHVIFKCTKS